MSITVETGPTETKLVSLAEVKSFLGISTSASDTLLNRMIDAVSEEVDKYLGYPLAEQTVTETLYGNGRPYLFTKYFPVTNISAVSLSGEALTSGEYLLEEPKTGKIQAVDAIWPHALGYSAPNVSITYTHGYALPDDLPSGVSLAVTKAVSLQFRNKDRDPDLKAEIVPEVHEYILTGKGGGYAAATGLLTPELISVLTSIRKGRV
jgi:hypothetical protein